MSNCYVSAADYAKYWGSEKPKKAKPTPLYNYDAEPWEILEQERQRKHKALQRKANNAVYKAVKRGDLPKLPNPAILCVDCAKHGEDRPARHYDHRDYLKPLDVEAVCNSCNQKRGRSQHGAKG